MISDTTHLLLWFKHGSVYSAPLRHLPEALIYEGEIFRRTEDYLGDVDYLRDEGKELIGFSFILGDEGEQEEAIHESLIAQCNGIKREDGLLLVLINPRPFDIECVQAVGTAMYRSMSNKIMLAVPNAGFSKMGFTLSTNDIPFDAVKN